jgi:hypothetical protein
MICDENPEVEVEASQTWGPWCLGPHCPTFEQLFIQKCSFSKMKMR